MNQQFLDQLDQAGYDPVKLKALLEQIDSDKRSIKSSLSRLSSEPDEQYAHGRERQTLIRRMKDKLSFLTEDREIVRNRLGQLKKERHQLNAVKHQTESGFVQAFMLAASQELPESQFQALEKIAAEICHRQRPLSSG